MSFADENIRCINDQGLQFFRNLAARATSGELWDLGFTEDPKVIETFHGSYPKHVIGRHYWGGVLEVENLLLEPVELVGLRLESVDGMQDLPFTGTTIPASSSTEPSVVRIPIAIDRLEIGQRLHIDTEVKGDRRSIQLRGSLDPDVRNPLLAERSPGELVAAYPFLAHTDGVLQVQPGTWSVAEPIVLPEGVELSLAAGSTLEFCPSCYLIVKAPIRLQGTATAPIRLVPQQQSWKGLYVLEAGGESRLQHVEISGATEVADSALMLTGGVVFYRSDVSMQDVRIVDAGGEDALNVIHSTFSLADVEICRTHSDGFDADFTTGELHNVTFCDIGGDALDTSGSQIRATNVVATGIHDKAISIGERSQFTVENARLERVGTGIVAKDSSTVEGSDLSIHEHELFAAMVYQKKSFYGPAANLTLRNVTVADRDNAFVAQTGNTLRVDDQVIPTTQIDIEALYATGPMQK